MKNLSEIQRILREVVTALDFKCSRDWQRYFSNLLADSLSLSSDDDIKDWARKIIHVYGGMCSFSDLALAIDGKILKKESSHLHELREVLFDEAMKLIESTKPNSDKETLENYRKMDA